MKNIETTYEHILQETSTELNELENSIKNKQDLVERLREEILNMVRTLKCTIILMGHQFIVIQNSNFQTVRRELMAKAMDKINSSHQVGVTWK